MAVVKTIRVFGDRVNFNQTCRGCGVRLWFIKSVQSGKWLPCDREPVALATESPYEHAEGAVIWRIDADVVHFSRCPDAERFRRAR